MRSTLALLTLVAAAAAPAASALASSDEDLTVVVDPRTGAASLRNDSGATLVIDGYLLTAPIDVFDVSGWTSLADSATPGWIEGQANDLILSEVNLEQSLAIAPGQAVPIGSPYDAFTLTSFGEAAPGFNVSYRELNGLEQPGEVEFVVENNIVLFVDPNTGAATLQNQSEFDVSISSYLIQSAAGVLDVDGWSTLEDNAGFAGWQSTSGTSSVIGEINIGGTAPVAAGGGSIAIGTPIYPSLLDDESDLLLQISVETTSGDPAFGLFGSVVFEAPPEIISDLAGDFNGDGVVGAEDFTVWRDNLGQSDNNLLSNNGDGGVIGISDYNLWVANFGNSLATDSSASISVTPEPTALLLMLIGCCGLGAHGSVRNRG